MSNPTKTPRRRKGEDKKPFKSLKDYKCQSRRFVLLRKEDESGVSGTGVVAEGIEFSNGRCALTWLSPFTCTATYDSTKVLEYIHGHEGRTRIIFIDKDPNDENKTK